MTSVGSAFAQPLTRTFVVTQDANQGEQGAYYFTDDAIDAWYAANSARINKVGSVYVIPGTTSGTDTFYDVLRGQGPNTELGDGRGLGIFSNRLSLLDLGKQIVIGTSTESRLLVLRRVRAYGSSLNGGDSGATGYVVVENFAGDLPGGGGNWGRFTVRVARV